MRHRNIETTPPRRDTYGEWLRYMVQSCEPEAGELGFLVSMWSCYSYNGHLSEEQKKLLEPYIEEARLWLLETGWGREDDMTNVVPLCPIKRAQARQSSTPAPSPLETALNGINDDGNEPPAA